LKRKKLKVGAMDEGLKHMPPVPRMIPECRLKFREIETFFPEMPDQFLEMSITGKNR
jgi:hypothetical protein